MPINRSTDAAISQRTNVYAEREMLKHAGPVMVLDKFAMTKRMPKNKSTIIRWRRPIVFTAATTPLLEGVTPSATTFGYEDVSATLRQYGMVVSVTDVIEDTHEDPVLQDATLQCGENIGRTMERLTYAVVRAGTSVFFSNGVLRTDVNTPISLAKQRAITRALKAQKAMKITSILSSSPDYNTSPVEAAYVAVAHTDLENDIRNMPGFIPTAEYGSRQVICPEELGTVDDVRYVLSPDLEEFQDAGGPRLGMVSQSGTLADVYPVLFFGRDAYGTVGLKGQGAVEPTIIPVNNKTKDDPLGQRGYVGWKSWFAAVRLNETWMARLEVACTAL